MTDTATPPQGATVPAKQEEKWLKVIETNKGEFQKALGNSIPVDFFNRVAITAVRKTPLLAQCSIPSLIGEMMTCAQIQLVLDGALGEAWLVPFYDSKLKCYEAKLMIGYKGLVKIIRRNNEVMNLTADIVRENDLFVYRKGTRHELTHEPLIRGDRGAWLGAYAFIEYKNGGCDFQFTDSDYILRVMAASKGSDKEDSPWKVWPETMWCKTAVKQLSRYADLSPKTREAIAKDLDLGAIDVESTVSHAGAITESTRLLRDEQADKEAAEKAEAAKVVALKQQTEPEKPKAPAPAPATAPKAAAPPAPAAPAPVKAAATAAPEAPPATKPAAPPPKPPVKPPTPAAPPASRKTTLVQKSMTADELAKANEEWMRQNMPAQAKKPEPAPAATPAAEPPPWEGGNDPEGDPFAPKPNPAAEAQLGDTLFPD